jgi:3-oxo-5alpha-steroid 4-dehydrogenase
MSEITGPIRTCDVTQWRDAADIVIVGYGIAGACAALEARRAGAEVLVIERASGGGGASAISCGIFYLGGGTPVQTACGFADTPDNLYRYLEASIQPSNPDSLRAFCDGSVEHFNWLEAQGIPFERTAYHGKAMFLMSTECLLSTGNEAVWPFREIATPVMRGHAVAAEGDSAGGAAMTALFAQCEHAGVRVLYDGRVTDLITDEAGNVAGVRLRQAGSTLDVRANCAVIIAAGGFSFNREMVKTHLPALSETAEPFGIPYNDGAGILLGQSVGGAVEEMDGVVGTASFYPPADLIKGILVNARGERFVAEDSYHGRTASHIMLQPDQVAYLIVDSEIFAYPELEFPHHTLVDGWDTVAEMEAGLNIPTGALQHTLAEYNADVKSGGDGKFHKHHDWLKPLDHPPYAAFDVSCSRSTYLYLTLGGLHTNQYGEVLGSSGQPLGGLYAVGGSAAHLPRSGMSYASGLSLATGSFFGRQAGQHAALRCAQANHERSANP